MAELTDDRLAEIRLVAEDAAQYQRGDRSMMAGETLSSFANRVTANIVVDLVDAVIAARIEVERQKHALNEYTRPPRPPNFLESEIASLRAERDELRAALSATQRGIASDTEVMDLRAQLASANAREKTLRDQIEALAKIVENPNVEFGFAVKDMAPVLRAALSGEGGKP